MSSCPSATRSPSAVSSRTGRCSEPVCGSETKPSPARRARPARRSSVGRGVQAQRPGVVGDAPADQPVLEQGRRQHLGGAQRRVAGVVDQHRDPASGLGGQCAHPAYVLTGIGVGVLDPRDATHHVGAELDRLADQLLGAGVAQQAVLREGDDLEVDHTPELLAQRQQRDHALQPGLGVDVGEGQHVPDAVSHRLEDRPPGVRLDPAAVVVRLHRRGQLDRGERGGHVAGGVRRQSGVADLLDDTVEGVHLVEVQVAVDEALGDQSAGRVDLLAAGDRVLRDGSDASAVDPDPPAALAAAQGRVGDDQVVVGHGSSGPSWSTTRSKVPRSKMFLAR